MTTALSPADLTAQLASLGVSAGDVLVVHTAFSRVAPVDGGPLALIDALQRAVGEAGTLVMPSMADDDEHPFDPASSPCRGMGIVADTFWRLPGVRRSDSPHAFAARGPMADAITAPHPVTVPHGLESPVGRVYDLDGRVLLIGVGHDANTTLHLAENLAGVRYRRAAGATVMLDGAVTRVEYGEVDHCCENFARADEWLDAARLQRRGVVGHAEARSMRSRDLVFAARARLRDEELVFLHPPGVCEQCDEARASITNGTSS